MIGDEGICVLPGFALPFVSASEQAAIDAAVYRAYRKMLDKVRPADEPLIVEPVISSQGPPA